MFKVRYLTLPYLPSGTLLTLTILFHLTGLPFLTFNSTIHPSCHLPAPSTMGTRGLRVVRFRKRYYQFYQQLDSYPEYLGSKIAATIPTDAVKYQEWLATQRKSVEEWEALYEAFLTVKPGNENPADLPEFMHQQIPSLLAPLNDLFIEWIYIVDLDREVFSVNNGAHFKLDQVPHIDWINSLTCGSLGDQISVPGTIPLEALTSLVAERTFQTSNLSQKLSDLDVGFTFPHSLYDNDSYNS